MWTSLGELSNRARAAFAATFAAEPTALASAPGRVELLGNHTDYNGGLVLAAAIDRATVVVGRGALERDARVVSVNFGESDRFSIDAIEPSPPGTWSRYIRGVCWSLGARYGRLASGFEAVVAGEVPLGAGLSSSASLQAAFGRFLIQLGLFAQCHAENLNGPAGDNERMELAQALRRSENEFVGVGSGLLDQFSSLFGRAGHALFLDCASLEYDRVPLGKRAPAIVVCDSRTSRRLADGMYDRRRAECERVTAYFRNKVPHQRELLLSALTLEQLEREWDELDPIGRKRARHVLSENQRVRQGVSVLKAGDVAAFGRLMSASHKSSRDDFENSAPALDALIEAAENAPGFLGGKLSGAGWAGCTVNLVQAEQAQEFAEIVRSTYSRVAGITPEIHLCSAAEGAAGCALVPGSG